MPPQLLPKELGSLGGGCGCLRTLYISSDALRRLPPEVEAHVVRRLRSLYVYDDDSDVYILDDVVDP